MTSPAPGSSGTTPPTSTVYLDHAATTPMLPAAIEAMNGVLTTVGNASSLHGSGRAARRRVEESREAIAECLGARPSEVIFTSGGTESDNLAVKGIYWARRDADPRRVRILASAVEHHAVLDAVEWLVAHEGAEVTWLPVDHVGRVDPESLRAELARHAEETALVTIMWANNEIGTIMPIAELATVAAEFDVPMHSDAVHGGGHERDLRSGTSDTAAVVGMAAARRAVTVDLAGRQAEVARLRDRLIADVTRIVPDAVLNGPVGDERLPGNVHFTFPGCEGDSLLMLLDAAGIECSTGSACTAGVPRASHVLIA